MSNIHASELKRIAAKAAPTIGNETGAPVIRGMDFPGSCWDQHAGLRLEAVLVEPGIEGHPV